VLWRDPPTANLPARFALRDTVLAGQAIEKGDALILGFTAANADPRVHGDDQWGELGNRSHLAFSAGPHMCPAQCPPGSSSARRSTRPCTSFPDCGWPGRPRSSPGSNRPGRAPRPPCR
jgi:hypothetical protein